MYKLLVSVLLSIACLLQGSVLLAASPEGEKSSNVTDTESSYILKRYNIFFRINSPEIDKNFKDNARTIETMREDIETTLKIDGAVPDSLLILSTASPDGGYEFNKRLARNRAISTEKMLLEMFPEFKDAHIQVEFLEEDWDGLLQVLKTHPEFPQREEMLAVIYDDNDVQSKEYRLRALKQGWRYLVNNYIYALRNSSITLSVVMTATNADDEFVRSQPMVRVKSIQPEPVHFEGPPIVEELKNQPLEPKFHKTILAARTNMLVPGLNFGMEIPIGWHWSIGLDYYYPWAVSAQNQWCGEMLGWFIDAKYWITGDKHQWTPTSKLKGHAIGLYGGVGYYDYQKITNGVQGEYADFGVDYTFALPVAEDKLRLEFNLGVGFIYTLYRPYYPSSDFEDLIKEPGVKYRTTNFIGPTRASVSLVWPITVPCKNPYTKLAKKAQRKEDRKNKRKGGQE
jgi:hypothetical protein